MSDDRTFCCVCGSTYHIERHHIKRRSQGGGDEDGNRVPLCRACHAAHHSTGYGLIRFATIEGALHWSRGIEAWKPCVFYDEARDPDSPEVMTGEDGERLWAIGRRITERASTLHTATWYTSRDLLDALSIFEERYDGREARARVVDFAANLEPPIYSKTVHKMLATAILPDADTIHVMPLTTRYRLVQALKRRDASFEDILEDCLVMRVSDFVNKYRIEE